MKVYAFNTGNFKLDGGSMFGVVPRVLWQKSYPADENNLCNWAMRSLLVVDGDRKILMETGIGDKHNEKFLKNYQLNGGVPLEACLVKYGISADTITDVVLSHLHFDHCGGCVRYTKDGPGFELVFKNACHWISRQQWESALRPNKREKASYVQDDFLPIQELGKVQLVDTDTQICPNVMLRLYHGHTSGQILTYINYNGRMVVLAADLIPSAAHIPLPYIMAYDNYPLITLQEKEAFLNEAVEKNYILYFVHDLYHECATLQSTEKGIRTGSVFTLDSLV